MSVSTTLTNLINNIANNLTSNEPNINYVYDAIVYFNEVETVPALFFSYSANQTLWRLVSTNYNGIANYSNQSKIQLYNLTKTIVIVFVSLINILITNLKTTISTTTDQLLLITYNKLLNNYIIIIKFISKPDNLNNIVTYYSYNKYF